VDASAQFDIVIELAEELGLVVRYEPIDGDSGGLCRIKGRHVLFVDTLADVATRLQRSLEALARLPGIDEHYIRPDVREWIDRARESA
jgi:hypothetical protein